MLFSIVIPIYNGLSYGLPQCLDSIWNQPLDGSLYEVICVDDCSTDDTRMWLTKQTQQHANLRVIYNEENLRQGGSRNKGIRAAQGKYIVFIDQDDYYHHDAIAKIYKHLRNSDLQILIVDCAYQYFGKENNTLQHNFPHREVMTGDEIIARNSIPYAPWKFIIERNFLIEHNLFFIEHERIEDVDWVHKVVHYADRVQYQPILFIHYNKYPDSTTMSSFSSKEVVYSGLRMANRLNSLVPEFHDERCRKYVEWLAERNFYNNLRAYLFFYDSPNVKHSSIVTNVDCNAPKYTLVRVAKACPWGYSIVSNICVPLSRMCLYIMRFIKQLHR